MVSREGKRRPDGVLTSASSHNEVGAGRGEKKMAWHPSLRPGWSKESGEETVMSHDNYLIRM